MGTCLSLFGFGRYKKIPEQQVDIRSSESLSLESSGYAFSNPNYEEPDWDYGIYEELPPPSDPIPINTGGSSRINRLSFH